MLLVVWMVGLVLTSPAADASGSLKTAVAEIQVENGHESNCVESVTGLCPASIHGDDPGTLTIDTYQRFDYVGVAPNVSGPAGAPGVAIPSHVWRIDSNDMVFPQPLIPILTSAVGARWAPAPLGDFGVVFTERSTRIHYGHPDPREADHRRTSSLGPAYGDRDLRYDRVGPTNNIGDSDTDTYVTSFWNSPCQHIEELNCTREANILSGVYRRSTPNVRNGAEWYIAEAATDPDALSPPGLARRGPDQGAPAGLRRDATSAMFSLPWVAIFSDAWLPAAATPSAPLPPAAHAPGPHDEPEPPIGVEPAGSAQPRDTALPATVAISIAAATLAAIASVLYSRIRDRKQALASPRRARIMEILDERNPLTLKELCQQLGKGGTAVEHHLRILEHHGLLRVVREAGCVEIRLPRMLPGGRGFLTRSPVHRAIYDLIAAHPEGVSRGDLRAATSHLATRTRNHAIRQLINRGLVEATEGGVLRTAPH